MGKSLSLYKLFASLFVMTAFLCFSGVEIKAQFNLSDFNVVNRTIVYGGPSGGSFASNVGGNPWRYRLTDAHNYKRCVIWNKIPLCLTENFMISMKLNFGNKDTNGADGMAFILQQLGSDVIGFHGDGLGYQLLGQSFAVAFDTWKNFHALEPNIIMYYRNGDIVPINGEYGYIQDNGVTVKTGLDYCVTIIWIKNSNGGWDLTTSVVEYGTNELKNRHTMHFPNLSDLFDGVSDSNSSVWWGISAATGMRSNEHIVEFISLYNGDYTFTNEEDCIRFDLVVHSFICTSPPPLENNFPSILWDTVFSHEDCPVLTCEGFIFILGERDTITIDVPCPQQLTYSVVNYYFQLDTAMQGAKVYIWSDSANKFIEIDAFAGNKGNNYYKVPWRESRNGDLVVHKERILKLEYKEIEYIIKINFGVFTDEILALNPNIKGSTSQDSGSMLVKNGEEITINLPELEGENCVYLIQYDNTAHFTGSPPTTVKSGEEFTLFSLKEFAIPK